MKHRTLRCAAETLVLLLIAAMRGRPTAKKFSLEIHWKSM